tara:strand:+ start:17082 stop:17306 length:225 start_codon:yes stop_codon:yes gene_type:complete
MIYKGIYEIDDVSIQYEYNVDGGDWENPPHTEVEILSMKHQGIEVQDLLINIANDWYENVIESIEEYSKDKLQC